MWLTLYKLNNCFNDGAKIHLGLKYEDQWYCITHLNTNSGVTIPKYFLKMRDISEKEEYLKRIFNSAPNVLSKTNMKIHKDVIIKYDKFKLDSLKNKIKRHNGEKEV